MNDIKEIIDSMSSHISEKLSEIKLLLKNEMSEALKASDLEETERLFNAACKKHAFIDKQCSLIVAEINKLYAFDSIQNIGSPRQSNKHKPVRSGTTYEINLDEDWTKNRPRQIKINNFEADVRSWQDVYLVTAKYLHDLNPDSFNELTDNPDMQGRETSNIAYSPSGMRNSKLLPGTKIYLETHFSANSIRRMINLMIENLSIDSIEYKIICE